MSGRGSNETKVVRFFYSEFSFRGCGIVSGAGFHWSLDRRNRNNPGTCRIEGKEHRQLTFLTLVSAVGISHPHRFP
jgi:hypothetical protein